MYLALGIIFLIFSLILAAAIIFTLARSLKEGGDPISKKNILYLAPTFLLIYLLHLTASAFNGEDLDFFYCFSLIYTTLDVLKFKAVKTLLLPICEANPIYYVDFVLAFVAGGATVILSIASFFGQRIRNYFAVRRLLKNNCDIVIGDSENALKYNKFVKNCLVIASKITRQRYADLMKAGVTVVRLPFNEDELVRKLNKGNHNIIVFRDGNFSYTDLINKFTALRKNGCDVHIHFEAYQEEMKILKEKFISETDKDVCAYISCFSKYELMARRFVADYPITKYIPRSFFNDNLTLKNDKQINIVFVGFGKVNYQLFRMCAMQFQFAEESKGRLSSKPVRYIIYDKEDARLHNEFFSRILYEFDEEFKDCDFPKPEKICELNIHGSDINSVEAKMQFRSLVSQDSFTYFIISLEGDLEDASYAQTVKRLLKNESNYRIFVRAKNNGGEKLNSESDSIIYFGEEKKLYTHDSIVNDDLNELAQRINLLYNKISNPPEWLKTLKEDKNKTAEEQRKILNEKLAVRTNREYMIDHWAKLPYIEQASNLYHALNLPFKLNLLGFEMVKQRATDDCGVTEAEFNKYYNNSGRENDYNEFAFFYKTESSNVLAYIEHSRWNALYILYDYKQMKKTDMKIVENDNKDGKTMKSIAHKNIALKQHACITTYYGLKDLIAYKYGILYPDSNFEEAFLKNDERLQEFFKIYAYDYMDLDRLFNEVTAMGYKLVYNHCEKSEE